VAHLLDTNVTRLLYIATDEKNKAFFKPFHQVRCASCPPLLLSLRAIPRVPCSSLDLRIPSRLRVNHQAFTVRFLDDFIDRAHLGDNHLNQNHLGMVEQTVCANAHTFVGTPLSTFTGYITRMRGYYR
jgi:GDP-fucose protein O-fucosyltransferase